MNLDQKIKKELINLPIWLSDKVELWLVLKDLKLATELIVKETIFNTEERTMRVREKNLQQVTNFVKKVGLLYRVRDQYNPGWKKIKIQGKFMKTDIVFCRKIVLVAKVQEFIDELYWCQTTLDRFSEKLDRLMGKLSGFPPAAVEEYARNMKDFDKKGFPKTLVGIAEFQAKYKDKYWEPYVRYFVRRGHEEEDCLPAIKWADVIRGDLPQLAEKFEKKLRKAKVR